MTSAISPSLQRKATTNPLRDVDIPLTNEFLMALVNGVSPGTSLKHNSLVGLLTSHNIYIPACPLPWAFLHHLPQQFGHFILLTMSHHCLHAWSNTLKIQPCGSYQYTLAHPCSSFNMTAINMPFTLILKFPKYLLFALNGIKIKPFNHRLIIKNTAIHFCHRSI